MKSRLLFLLSFAVLVLQAQDPRGFIRGTVIDNSGAVVPGARVRAISNETGVTASSVANESGIYNLPYLIPGFYKIVAEQQGFKTFLRDKVEVRVSETVEDPLPSRRPSSLN